MRTITIEEYVEIINYLIDSSMNFHRYPEAELQMFNESVYLFMKYYVHQSDVAQATIIWDQLQYIPKYSKAFRVIMQFLSKK